MGNKKNKISFMWKKVKDGFLSFFFEPVEIADAADTASGSNEMIQKNTSSIFETIQPTGGKVMSGRTNSDSLKQASSSRAGSGAKEISAKNEASAAQQMIPTHMETERAYIPKDTVVEGNIVTSSDMQILGIINGNVTSEGQVMLSGKIFGDVQANALSVDSGTVSGNVTCKAGVTLSSQAIIKGGIDAQSVDCNGEIRGDVKTSKTVILRPNSLVCGDIITKTINMKDGAILQGNVKMPADKTSAQIYFEESTVQ